jgi:hypothetical protein
VSEHDETPVEDSGMPPKGYVPYDEDVSGYFPAEQPWLVRNALGLFAGIIGAGAVWAFVNAILYLNQT